MLGDSLPKASSTFHALSAVGITELAFAKRLEILNTQFFHRTYLSFADQRKKHKTSSWNSLIITSKKKASSSGFRTCIKSHPDLSTVWCSR